MILKLIAAMLFYMVISTISYAQVGIRELQSQGMSITVVYPTSSKNQKIERGPFQIEAVLDAPLSKEAKHLIILSHGTAGSAISDFQLASTLASAGFVVAEPQHRGDNYLDFSRAGPKSWQTRPDEIIETINYLAQSPNWNTQLDFNHIGVHGMSAGGMTALVMAGAQWRILSLIQHCEKNAEADIGFCLNGLANKPDEQAKRLAQFKSAANVPETYLPNELTKLHGGKSPTDKLSDPRPDTRITAVSALVPLSAIFSNESLAKIQIPVAISTASEDEVLAPKFHSDQVLRYCNSCMKINDGKQSGHFDWLSPWPISIAKQVAAQQIRGGLPHDNFTEAQRQLAFDTIAKFFKKTIQP